MVLDFLAINVLSKEYNSIRITDIAKKANVSVGTVYLYFHSKDDIATTLVHERNEILTQNQEVDTEAPVVEQFYRYVDSYLHLIQSDGFEFSRLPSLKNTAVTRLLLLPYRKTISLI